MAVGYWVRGQGKSLLAAPIALLIHNEYLPSINAPYLYNNTPKRYNIKHITAMPVMCFSILRCFGGNLRTA